MGNGADDERTKSAIFEEPCAGQARVLVYWQGGTLARTLSPQLALTIGRSHDCELCVDHPSVSRRHALLRFGPPLSVEDLGSSNGTRLGGRKLPPRIPTEVPPGALIEVGLATVIAQGGEVLPMSAPSSGAIRLTNASPADAIASGDSTMDRVRQLIELMAPGRISVLLCGETGVGKEVLAEIIHAKSPRKNEPLVRIHCAAFPEALLESELFGHEKGAFTGASASKLGLLESAHRGTVLFDEVGELPVPTQVKLLRVIETRQVQRLGALRATPVDVRFIAATHRDLAVLVAEGAFRQDLYFRLNGVTITIPPLRDRIREIESLAREFVQATCASMGWPTSSIGPDAMKLLERYPWPGNIRELRNELERAAMFARGAPIEARHLQHLAETPATPTTNPSGSLAVQIAELEKRRILDALDETGGNQTQAAKRLGLSRNTLLARLEAYGVLRPRKRG